MLTLKYSLLLRMQQDTSLSSEILLFYRLPILQKYEVLASAIEVKTRLQLLWGHDLIKENKDLLLI